MIVIKNNEASEFYAKYCKKSWEDIGIEVKIFDAIVPDDLSRLKELRWSKYVNRLSYEKRNLQVEMTETEKACLYSHYLLWKKCVSKNRPLLILEHDAYLDCPENLWFDFKYGIIFYDKAATGSYVIFPWFAKELVEFAKNVFIDRGIYALLYIFAHKKNLKEYLVDVFHPKYKSASDQVMSEKYGNTIEHYYLNKANVYNFKKI
jgi:GR25 family glycosyltransferase involved in LPS biosynthesis